MDLKPCPFCGNNEVVLITRHGKDGWRDRFFVLCDYNDGGCGASGGWYHYQEEAIESWNKRESVADVPSAVHGRWIISPGCLWPIGDCSMCGEQHIGTNDAKYCPHCGAKMDLEV